VQDRLSFLKNSFSQEEAHLLRYLLAVHSLHSQTATPRGGNASFCCCSMKVKYTEKSAKSNRLPQFQSHSDPYKQPLSLLYLYCIVRVAVYGARIYTAPYVMPSIGFARINGLRTGQYQVEFHRYFKCT
jgi:hypothetical protein